MKPEIKISDSIKNMYSKKTDKAWEDLYSKISEEETTEVKKHFNLSIALKIAAGIAILAGFVWAITQFITPGEQIAQTNLNQTKVFLADGSIVLLNANSQLKYPKSFNKKIRKVKLSGEAFFDVSKDPDKAFVIETKNSRITVIGTSFNVLAPGNSEVVEVLVESGAVGLATKENKNIHVLIKGDYAKLEKNTINKIPLTDENYLSWKTKKLNFRNKKLKDVIFVLNRTYATNIKIDNNVGEDLQLTSKFDNIELKTIIESICLTFNLKYEKIDGEIIITNVKD